MVLRKQWVILGFLLCTLVAGLLVASGVQGDNSTPEFIYDVVVVELPQPTALTDNRSDSQRLAAQITNLLNTNALEGWLPDQMWGTGPVFVLLKKPKN